MSKPIPAMLMRGGTSKGLYLEARHLPTEPEARDACLLSLMGSPDPRQIDGLGGAHPLTSKVAIISPPSRPDADVDYLFQQVTVDKPQVSGAQNCGNILAGVGPFAIERGLVPASHPVTPVRIHMLNTGTLACAYVPTPGGVVDYTGDTRIDGVPGTASAIRIEFADVAGSSCGALFPTGRPTDDILNTEVTCIDNGMPVVIMNAADFGLVGSETPEAIEADKALCLRVESIRLAAGRLMNLGDVTKKTIPKMTLVSPARHGGTVSTRTFIPHRVHDAIGVLGAVSVATAIAVPETVAAKVAAKSGSGSCGSVLTIEHPTGYFAVEIDLATDADLITVKKAALLRTARKLMDGIAFTHGDHR
jgi:4-oxalomesaconate tautomerase